MLRVFRCSVRTGDLFLKIAFIFSILLFPGAFKVLVRIGGFISEAGFALYLAGFMGLFFFGVQNCQYVPHWAYRFGLIRTIKLLKDEIFDYYVTKDGTVCEDLLIGTRWFCIGYKNFPTKLVAEVTKKNNDLQFTMIDGGRAVVKNVTDENTFVGLREMFGKDFKTIGGVDSFYRWEDHKYKEALGRVIGEKGSAIAKADWNDLRLSFDKEIRARENNSYYENSHRNAKARTTFEKCVGKPGKGSKAKLSKTKAMFYNEILLDCEIDILKRAIDLNKSLGWELSDFMQYREDNENATYNSVRLISRYEFPESKEGMDFLFDCMKDISKPDYQRALAVLKEFPSPIVRERIDLDMEKAQQQADALWIAGLMGLAREFNYNVIS